jgi:hypothetical protein
MSNNCRYDWDSEAEAWILSVPCTNGTCPALVLDPPGPEGPFSVTLDCVHLDVADPNEKSR